MRFDQILYPDETGVGFVAVVDDALPHVLIHVGTVMVCFYGLARVGGVGVEGVEMGAELFWRVEVLDH